MKERKNYFAEKMREYRKRKKEKNPLCDTKYLYVLKLNDEQYIFKNKKDIINSIKKIKKENVPEGKMIKI